MAKTLNFKVVGEHTMHCAGCERSITFTHNRFLGITEVNADWEKQTIQVQLSSDEVKPEKIMAELDWIGYEVAEV